MDRTKLSGYHTVRQWCHENKVNVSNYYKWQRKIYALAKEEQESQFADITPVMELREAASVAIAVHAAGVSADIHNGADPATVEAVLRILKLRSLEIHKRTGAKIEMIAEVLNPVVGWINYFGRYNRSAMKKGLDCVQRRLTHGSATELEGDLCL